MKNFISNTYHKYGKTKFIIFAVLAVLIALVMTVCAYAVNSVDNSDDNLGDFSTELKNANQQTAAGDNTNAMKKKKRTHDNSESADLQATTSNSFAVASNEPSPKAVYKDSTLTFYYDNLEHDGRVYDASGERTWSEISDRVNHIVIDVSFSNYCPKSFDSFFSYCNLVDVEGFLNLNTSECVSMRGMFCDTPEFTGIDWNNFYTGKVKYIDNMFTDTGFTSLDLSNFDMSNVVSAEAAFWQGSHKGLNYLNLSGWDCPNLTYADCMFGCCDMLQTIDLSNVNFPALNKTSLMFYSCSGLEVLDISHLGLDDIDNCNEMFEYCSNLRTIYVDSNTDLSNKLGTNIFQGCDLLVGQNGTSYAESQVVHETYARIDTPEHPGYFTEAGHVKNHKVTFNSGDGYFNNIPDGWTKISDQECTKSFAEGTYIADIKAEWEGYNPYKEGYEFDAWYSDAETETLNSNIQFRATYIEGAELAPRAVSSQVDGNYYNRTLTFYYDNKSHREEGDVYLIDEEGNRSWNGDYINTVKFDESFKDFKPKTCKSWFEFFHYLKDIEGIQYLDTYRCEDMSNMFSTCTNLTDINLANFSTKNVKTMRNMFSDCWALTKFDLSSFETSNVKDMSNMFAGIGFLTNLDLSSFNTEKVTDMGGMFRGLGHVRLNLSSFKTSNVTNMECMFSGANIDNLDLSVLNTSNVTNMRQMFSASIANTIDISSFDLSKVTDMTYMFMGNNYFPASWPEYIYLPKQNPKKADISYMFSCCPNLKTIYIDKDADWTKTSNYGERMFEGCNSLEGGFGSTPAEYQYVSRRMAKVDSPDEPGYFTSNTAYTVTFDSSSGTKVKKQSIEPGECAFEPSSPVMADSYFENWYDSSEFINVWDFNTPISENITLYAKFAPGYLAKFDLKGGQIDEAPFGWQLINGLYTKGFAEATEFEQIIAEWDKTIPQKYMSEFRKWNPDGGPLYEDSYFEALYNELCTVYLDNGTLYFKSDNNSAYKSKRKFVIPETVNEAKDVPWNAFADQIKKVEFDAGMANNKFNTTAYFFYGMKNLKDVIGMDYLSTKDTKFMFANSPQISSLSFTGSDFTAVKNMQSMFEGCKGLTSVTFNNVNTSLVANTFCMFKGCSGLTNLDLSQIETVSAVNMREMFSGCSNLSEIDLSSFTVNKADVSYMFNKCYKLKTIYTLADADWSKYSAYGKGMFTDCKSLVGGNGTTYDASHIDKEYARVDQLYPDPCGYFTATDKCLVTMDLHGGEVDVVPDGWTSSTPGVYTKGFEKGSQYSDIIAEWKESNPHKDNNLFVCWYPTKGELTGSRTFNAKWKEVVPKFMQ